MKRFFHALATGLLYCLPLVGWAWAQNANVNPTAGMVWQYFGATLGAGWGPVPAAGTGVPDNTALAATAITTPSFSQGVWRFDFAQGVGAPPLYWRPQSGSCAASGYVSDGGLCQDAAGGGSWLAQHPAGNRDTRQWGQRFGAKIGQDGTATASSDVFNSPTLAATSAAVGRPIVVAGAALVPAATITFTGSVSYSTQNASAIAGPGTVLDFGAGSVPSTCQTVGARVYNVTNPARISADARVVTADNAAGFSFINASVNTSQTGDTITCAAKHAGGSTTVPAPAGSLVLTTTSTGAGVVGDVLIDEDNEAALAVLTTLASKTPFTITLSTPSLLDIPVDDGIGYYTPSSGTLASGATNSDTITFAAPPSCTAGQRIRNLSEPASLSDPTVVTAVIGSTVEVSPDITGTGVEVGDVIECADLITISESVSGLSVSYPVDQGETITSLTRMMGRLIVWNDSFKDLGLNAATDESLCIVATPTCQLVLPSWLGASTNWSVTVGGAGTEIGTVGSTTHPAPLKTTIAAVLSSTSVRLTSPATNTIANTQWGYGPDDTAPLNAALAAARRGFDLNLTAGNSLIDGQILLGKSNIRCQKVPQITQTGVTGLYQPNNTAFVLTNMVTFPFKYDRGMMIEGCTFFYPGQHTAGPVMVPYPATISNTEPPTTNGVDVKLLDINVPNAYDFWKQAYPSGSGQIFAERVMGNVMRFFFNINRNGGPAKFVQFQQSTSIYPNPITADPQRKMQNFVSNNSVPFMIRSFGTATEPTTEKMQGLFLEGGNAYGVYNCIRNDGGWMSESEASGFSCTAQQPLYFRYAVVSKYNIVNWTMFSAPIIGGLGGTSRDSALPAIDIYRPPPVNESSDVFTLQISKIGLITSDGSFLRYFGQWGNTIKVNGVVSDRNFGFSPTANAVFADFQGPIKDVAVTGNTISAAGGATPNKRGVRFLNSPQGAVANDNIFDNIFCPITLSGGTGKVVVNGNSSFTDRPGGTGLCGTITTKLYATANEWGSGVAGMEYRNGVPTPREGNATLVGGTIAVAVPSVTASTRVQLTRKTAAGTIGDLTYTLSAGVGFTINSASGTDTSVVTWSANEP